MNIEEFPTLEPDAIAGTRDAVHAYSQILGDWKAACLPHRKHWWELAVQPSIHGLTTGLVSAGRDFELELDLVADRFRGYVADGGELNEPLSGRPARELADEVAEFLTGHGMDRELIPADKRRANHAHLYKEYSPGTARDLAAAFRSVTAAFNGFRAGIREETSPIQLWPHHFDLAMSWLPGEKIPGQDLNDAELSDKQLNFGFVLGDAGIPEPYFYITAYPLPDAFPDLPLPAGTTWRTDGFSGAVLLYRNLVNSTDPHRYLVDLWNGLLAAGRQHLLTDSA